MASDDVKAYTLSLLKDIKSDDPRLIEICKEIDTLNDEKMFEESLELLNHVPENLEDDVEILWRQARGYFDRAELKPEDKTWREEWIREGMKWAERAVAKDPDNWAAHKWFAVLISQLGDFVSMKEKIVNAFSIQEHALRALELRPRDPVTLHILGRWCYEVAHVSWLETKLASTIWAAPPKSSYEEAFQYFKQADDEHHWISNLYYLGLTCKAMGKDEEANRFFQAAIDMPARSPQDTHFQNLAAS